jgi:peptide deformylase
MPVRIDVYHHIDLDAGVRVLIGGLSQKLDLVLTNQEKIMIDTSAVLAAVAQERTELASWKTLVEGMSATMKDLAAQLAAAIAANDPVALAAVQADLDKAASDLNADNADAAAAIAANTPTP